MNIPVRYILWLFCTAIIFSSCEKKWDEHTQINDPILEGNLLELVNKDPELSKFSEYLKQTGYDTVLASSKTFTVWAPTNTALQSLDPEVINTPEKLELFVGNHIADQTHFTTAISAPFIRLKTLNGKNVSFSPTSVDNSALVSKDLYTGNGVLNKIDEAIIPKVSAWEYLMSTSTLQKQLLESYNYTYRDLNRAEVIGIDPDTGDPIYKDGTGVVNANTYLNTADDISNEDSLYTYIVLTDAAFNAEKDKLDDYYTLGSQDSTDSLTKLNVIKDLAFRGTYDVDNLPATIYSATDSVKFHLDKNAIVEIHPVSNGVVYVMSSINYDLVPANGAYDPYTKIKPIKIEGEFPASFLSNKTNSEPVRVDPNTGDLYTQLFVENHGTAKYWAKYLPQMVNSTKYKVYWRVVRDYGLTVADADDDLEYSPMRLAFKTPADVTPGFPYVPKPGVVPILDQNGQPVLDERGKPTFAPDYELRELGEYTIDKYYSASLKNGPNGRLPIYLVGNDTKTNGQNDLLLDYILMIPVQ